MSDSTSGPLNPVDQGTVFMLSISFAALAIAFVYFACLWYRKRRQSRPQRARAAATTSTTTTTGSSKSKSNIARSFSRFSQVDEELTFVAPDETDFDLLATGSPTADAHAQKPPPHSAPPKRNRQIHRSRAATQTLPAKVSVSPAPTPPTTKEFRKSAPPGDRVYLETSI